MPGNEETVMNDYRREVGNMPRGKKTPPEVVYKVMTSWASTDNYSETARELNMAMTTVEKIVKDNKDKPEFVKLCEEKRNSFSKRAESIINKALNRLEREIDNEDKDIPVNHLTNAIGILTDKKLLVDGKPTEKIEIIGEKTLDKLAELAGYEKR